jgi:hypothetical protein
MSKIVDIGINPSFRKLSICLFSVLKQVVHNNSAGARQAPLRQLKLQLRTDRFPQTVKLFFLIRQDFIP